MIEVSALSKVFGCSPLCFSQRGVSEGRGESGCLLFRILSKGEGRPVPSLWSGVRRPFGCYPQLTFPNSQPIPTLIPPISQLTFLTLFITFARMKAISTFISYLFHPFLFPLFGAILVLGLNPNMFGHFGEVTHIKWLIVIFALTFMFPSVWILMMKGLEMIDSLKMETPKECIVPFVATITFYLWATWMFKANVAMKMPGNPFLFYMMLGACISISVAFFLNSWAHISLHALGAGSIIGLLLILIKVSTFDIRFLFVVALILAGLLGTARLILKGHTESEVLGGYFIGFIGQFLAFSVASRFI